MGPYLTTLCSALAQSMISDNRAVSIKFTGTGGISTSRNAESIGLIVTELVINSLKHAFDETTKGGEISVAYDVSGTDWQLAVSDNGSGKPDGVFAQPKTGLGTGVVKALAKQLDAQCGDIERCFGDKSFDYSRHVCSRVIYIDHYSVGQRDAPFDPRDEIRPPKGGRFAMTRRSFPWFESYQAASASL